MKFRFLMPLLLFAAPLWSHQPKVLNDNYTVEGPEISHALYGKLDADHQRLTVRMTFEEPFAMPFEVLVPHRAELEDFRPAYAILSAGLPEPTAEERAVLAEQDIEVPDGYGVYVENNDNPERLVIFESFTRRVFWSTGPVAVALGEGETVVHIWATNESYGPLTLGFGVEEDFSDGFGEVFEDWETYAY